jgi:steroid delta-isomerase-like uncharacterized protein
MQSDKNKTIARRFIQAWNAGGESIVETLASPDITVFYSHFPQPVHGAEAFKAILRQTHTSFPDLQISVQEVIEEGEQVVVFWSYQGTHQHGEVFGYSPTGKQVRVSGITRFRIDSGKVAEESGLVDNFSLMQQLGGK